MKGGGWRKTWWSQRRTSACGFKAIWTAGVAARTNVKIKSSKQGAKTQTLKLNIVKRAGGADEYSDGELLLCCQTSPPTSHTTSDQMFRSVWTAQVVLKDSTADQQMIRWSADDIQVISRWSGDKQVMFRWSAGDDRQTLSPHRYQDKKTWWNIRSTVKLNESNWKHHVWCTRFSFIQLCVSDVIIN